MGCLKLIYRQEEGLEKSVVYLGGSLCKKVQSLKKCDSYYPFGLQHATSWTRSTTVKNNRLYNAGSEFNEQTKNYETFYRNYDPAIGRFTAIDIMAGKYTSITPYQYAFNDPVAFNDPLGDDPNSENCFVCNRTDYRTTMERMNAGDADLASRGQRLNSYGGMTGAQYDQIYKSEPLGNSGFTSQDAYYIGQALGLNVYINKDGGLNFVTYAQSYNRKSGRITGTNSYFNHYLLSDAGQNGAGGSILDTILDWLPGERYNGSETLISAGTNIQLGIKRIGSITFNPLSEVLSQKEWSNNGNESFRRSAKDGISRMHQEFGFAVGFGINYQSVFDADTEYGILNGIYSYEKNELSISFYGITGKIAWGTEGTSIFYGGNIGVGLGIGVGGSAETWHGNVIKIIKK